MFIRFAFKYTIINDSEKENLRWLYNKIIFVVYVVIGLAIVKSIMISPEKVINLNSCRNLIINIILVSSVIVLTYLLAVYMYYEKLFNKLVHNKNRKIVRYIKIKLVIYAKLDVKKLDFSIYKKIFWMENKEEIKNAFKQMQ